MTCVYHKEQNAQQLQLVVLRDNGLLLLYS